MVLPNTSHPNVELALKIGQAAGLSATRGRHRHRVLIAKDPRLSGYMLEQALTAGLLSSGMDVFLLGPLPSPALGVLTRSMRADLGIMISAPNSLYDKSGITIFGHDGCLLLAAEEKRIEDILDQTSVGLAMPDKIGRATRIDDAQARYIELVKGMFPKMKLDGLRVVIDTAHGAAYKVAPTILSELGAEVIRIGDAPDGTNINEKCGSTAPRAMCSKVRDTRADIGIALNGDGSEVVIADETGAQLRGLDVDRVFSEEVEGENQSVEDGLVIALQLLAIVSKRQKKVSEVFADLLNHSAKT